MLQEEKEQLLNEAAAEIVENPTEDGQTQVVIEALAEAEVMNRAKNAAENYNLAQDIDPDKLSEIGKECFQGFEEDQASRTNWLKDHAFWLSLYMQKDFASNSDPERSWGASESIPILTEACDQFQSRTYKVFFPNDSFVSAIPMLKNKADRKSIEARAERVGRHMAYQLGYQDRTYRMDKDALFLGVAVHGSFFTKTYFSQKKMRFQVDNVRPTDLVVNYNVGPVRLEDLRRKTHIIYSTVGETEQLARQGYLLEAASPCSSIIDNEYNVVVDETQGLTEGNPSKSDAQAVLLEQQCYLDIGDSGELRPYIVTLDAAKQKVLRLVIGYEADINGQPLRDYEQVQYFTHYKYKENPDGFYGLGLGHSIGDLNSAANIMLRQSMDAATLANDGNMSGFISERLGLEGDDIRMSLGKLRKIPDTLGDFQNAVMLMQFPGPNPALLTIMDSIDKRAQRLGAVTEATTGTIDKVVQPTTLINQIDQALEQFSSVQMRLANSLSQEFQKIYRINQKYAPLVDYFVVNGEPEAITRSDYADDMLIQPVFDPRYATQQQKVARARAELDATLQNPVNQSRPQVIDTAFKRYLEALDVADVDELIPPPIEPEVFGDQYMENMMILLPADARVPFDASPQDNHAEHLAIMEELVPYMAQMQPDQIELIMNHKQKHEAYLYGQQRGVIGQAPATAQPEPTALLEAGQGDAMGLGGIEAQVPDTAAVPSAEVLGDSVSNGSTGGIF